MPDFDYDVLDGSSSQLKFRAEDLGLDGSNIRILGHKFSSDALGTAGDAPAADHLGTDTLLALAKGILRETITIATGGGADFAEGSVAGEDVLNTESVLAAINCKGFKRLGLIVQNSGGTAFNSFVTKVRYNSGFSFYFPEVTGGYGPASADQTGNATAIIRKFNGTDPVTLGAGQHTWIRFNVEAIESIQFTASVAAGSSTADLWWITEK